MTTVFAEVGPSPLDSILEALVTALNGVALELSMVPEEYRLAALDLVLDGSHRRQWEGERQALAPWGGWMHSTFLEEAALEPEKWQGRTEDEESRTKLDGPEGANLIHSGQPDGRHIVALDIDFPGRWVPSSTPGKGHLYINKPLTWEQVQKLLATLAEVGLVHRNYVKHTTARGYTCLRPAWVQKPAGGHFSSDEGDDQDQGV